MALSLEQAGELLVSEIRARQPRKASEIGLAEFVNKTCSFTLHEWQEKHLCPLLERLKTEKGLRIALHGPPRYGKSFIVSQRLPAYLVGLVPDHRVGLACYNETHATGFGQVVKDLMLAEDFVKLFPDPGVRIKKDAPAGRFFTAARQAHNDAQPSFLAMGLLSGFTGKGVDTLIVDDPYASADDAFSEIINEKVWRWWSATAGVRIAEDANVVVMFHRYHEDDFAGRLLATGGFEYVRFPAIADDNADGSDPTGRVAGDLLSPMRSREWLSAREAEDPKTFLGQFQGKPRPDEGAFFKREWLKQGPCPRLTRWVRYWDFATSTKESGDYTVGALVGMDRDHTIYVRDVVRFRAEWPDASEIIVETASSDSLMCQKEGADYQVGGDARATQQGFLQDLARKAAFERIPLWPDKSKGDKKQRASGWAARARNERLVLCPGSWDMQAFIAECMAFDGHGLTHDDQVDAVSGAYQLLWMLEGGTVQDEKQGLNPNSWEYFDALSAQAKEASEESADDY
ncbi:MAG: hypothetical protein QOJ65_1783 [Fimbriimonadaceae bacterium]|jgi:predicted phage terminase large subunit-like protein|nr:hypothetical protein [Fimbriimonadaceae bacterium]